jgi:cytochrome c
MQRIVLAALFVTAGLGQARAQNATAGEMAFAACEPCHQVGYNARNAVGPTLNGLFGRRAGSVTGYSYSKAMKESGITWDEGIFIDYINDPKAKVPGNKMPFPGIKNSQTVTDLIAYLHNFDDAPVKLGQ